MSVITVLLLGLFLPLFPLSVVFNQLLARLRHPLVRVGLLLVWPQLGVLLAWRLDADVPAWVLPWAGLTALLYAFRLLAQRDVPGWAGFLTTSAWSLLWLPLQAGGQTLELAMTALGFSIPLAVLVVLASALEQRFGAAYTHLYGGLAQAMPRFAGLLVFSTLAAVATPVFPAFFTLLHTLTVVSLPLALVVLLTWLVWSWAGIRLLQGLLIGASPQEGSIRDLPRGLGWVLALTLTLLAAAGLLATGGMA